MILISAVVILVSVLVTVFRLFSTFQGWVRNHRLWTEWHIHDYVFVFVILVFALGIFSLRRWRELRDEIAERQQAEEALRVSEERYRALAEGAHDAIFVLDRDGIVQYVNSFAAKELGRDPEEVIGKLHHENLFPPDVSARHRQELENLFQTGESIYSEDKLPFPDRELWQSVRLVPLRNPSGEVNAALGIARDITAHKQAEEELQRSAEHLRQLLEALPVATRVIQDGVVVFSNSADAALVGCQNPAEVIGTDAFDYVAAEDKGRLREYMMRREAGEPAPIHYEASGKRRDGTVFPMEVMVRHILYDGKPASLAIWLDLSERKRLRMYEKVLPVCCACGKIRDDTSTEHGRGAWRKLEEFLIDHSDASLSHTFCRDCERTYRQEYGLNSEPPWKPGRT